MSPCSAGGFGDCPKEAVHAQFGTSLAIKDELPTSVCGGIEREPAYKITPHAGLVGHCPCRSSACFRHAWLSELRKNGFCQEFWQFAYAFSVGNATMSWLLCFLSWPVRIPDHLTSVLH